MSLAAAAEKEKLSYGHGNDTWNWEVSPGVICTQTEDLYSALLCWVLAWHLHEQSGYPLALVGVDLEVDGTTSYSWVHAGVLTPEEKWLDVHGSINPGEALENWAEYLGEEELAEHGLDSEDVDVHVITPEVFLASIPTPLERVPAEIHVHAAQTARTLLAALQ